MNTGSEARIRLWCGVRNYGLLEKVHIEGTFLRNLEDRVEIALPGIDGLVRSLALAPVVVLVDGYSLCNRQTVFGDGIKLSFPFVC